MSSITVEQFKRSTLYLAHVDDPERWWLRNL